jgi:hypothetical protein
MDLFLRKKLLGHNLLVYVWNHCGVLHKYLLYILEHYLFQNIILLHRGCNNIVYSNCKVYPIHTNVCS